MMTKAEATVGARAFVRRLGKGWKPHVWENLGWHYSAISKCGRWKIHPCIYRKRIDGYTAFLGEPDMCGGRWAVTESTPRKAMLRTFVQAADAERAIAAITDGAELVIPKRSNDRTSKRARTTKRNEESRR